MSDTSQGPGWWQASDGKWYPPELYPKDWDKPNPAGQADTAATAAAETPAAAEAAVADVAPVDPAPAATPPADPAPVAEAPAQSAPAFDAPVQPDLPTIGQAPGAAAAEWAEPAAVPISAEPAAPTAFGAPPAVEGPNQWGAADTASAGAAAPIGAAPVTQSQPVVDPTATA